MAVVQNLMISVSQLQDNYLRLSQAIAEVTNAHNLVVNMVKSQKAQIEALIKATQEQNKMNAALNTRIECLKSHIQQLESQAFETLSWD